MLNLAASRSKHDYKKEIRGDNTEKFELILRKAKYLDNKKTVCPHRQTVFLFSSEALICLALRRRVHFRYRLL